ncbi:PaaI family thioesterase [Specibacter sp. RAF43]|uniref:PaaI family thioesterase n=1 Tax=Specibacter sp. RAF43 TaxID=3233057 RepID=UPI003F9AF86A
MEWAERLPPSQMFGIRCKKVARGLVCLEFTKTPLELNENGSAHGGIVAAVCDQAMALAVCTQLAVGWRAVTTELNVSYLRPTTVPSDITVKVSRFDLKMITTEVTFANSSGTSAVGRAVFKPIPESRYLNPDKTGGNGRVGSVGALHMPPGIDSIASSSGYPVPEGR